jgi:macrodomain Ter protein organizer (MatP/YcbG family)
LYLLPDNVIILLSGNIIGKDMARKKYQITTSDALTAWRWIQTKLNDSQWPNWDKAYQAEQEFENLKERWENPEALNTWAEKWLDRRQWIQLKNTVRAQRKRQRDRSNLDKKPVAITLSLKAHLILSTIAKHDNVTLSKVIEKRLHKTYLNII